MTNNNPNNIDFDYDAIEPIPYGEPHLYGWEAITNTHKKANPIANALTAMSDRIWLERDEITEAAERRGYFLDWEYGLIEAMAEQAASLGILRLSDIDLFCGVCGGHLDKTSEIAELDICARCK